MKIVLAFPADKRHLADHSTGLLPLGFLTMASCLARQGHEVVTAHLGRYRRKDAVQLILDADPDLVGLSCFTFQRHETLAMAAALRKARPDRAPFLLLGGPHAAPLAGEILVRVPAVDAIATGEGEQMIVELAARLGRGEDPAGIAGLATRRDGGVDEGLPPRLLESLDELPPSTEMSFPILGVSVPYQLRHLTASRGCAASCVFCRAPAAWGRHVRRRSVESFVAEITALRKQHGSVFLSFRDDTFSADRTWVQHLCRRLIEQDSDILWDCQTRVTALDAETADLMRRAGCVQVQVGLESGSDRILRILRKPFKVEQARQAVDVCRAAGLLVSLYLIYGVPGEKEEDIRQTEAFVRETRPSSVSIARLSLYPGTPLAESVAAESWFVDQSEDIHAWQDARALRHGERFQALEREVWKGQPFTVEELRAVSRRLPGPPTALALAQGLERKSSVAEAEKGWRDLLGRWPGTVWGEMGLGELLLETGRAGEAEPWLRRARDQAPRWPYPLDRLGWCLRLLGRPGEGQALIEEAFRLDPFTPPPPAPGRQ